VFLEELKWTDIAGLDRNQTLVICCIGAMEQHGLHLPLGTDYFIGTEIVRRIEAVMPDRMLCLPALWLGASSHHMDFPGTISSSTTTVRAVLHDVVSSIYHHGFRKMILLNSHGGNRALLATAIQDFGVEFAGMQIVGATYWDVAREELSKLRESGFGGIGHACELETSFILATHPKLVDRSKVKEDGMMADSEFSRGEMLSAPSVTVYKTFKETTGTGTFGDPTLAAAEKGEAMLSAVAERMAELCSHVLAGRI
jgi:creatinine amidohydrolase